MCSKHPLLLKNAKFYIKNNPHFNFHGPATYALRDPFLCVFRTLINAYLIARRVEGGGGYRPYGSGKLHQLLENPACTPMPTVHPLQIRPVFDLS